MLKPILFLALNVYLSLNNLDPNIHYTDILDYNIQKQYIVYEEQQNIEQQEGIIYVGDSRFVGMDNVCHISANKNYFVVAQSAQGYDWFVNEGIKQIEQIKNENSNIKYWTLIIGLGINDLYNNDTYINKYNELKENYNLKLVSVNPIEYHSYITNEDISRFNQNLMYFAQQNDIKYIDTYNHLITTSFETTDGVHYEEQTYNNIFNFIQNN